MKRWLILAALAVVISSVAVTVQFMGASTRPLVPVYPAGPAEVATKAGILQPKAVLEGEQTYYFGTLPQRTTGKHVWTVRNEGKGKLTLWMISSTCSCTLAKFKNGEKAIVPPGESTEIVLEYETRENNGTYEKGAEIGTNDPGLPQFSLHVKGQVFPAVQTFPPGASINYTTIANDEPDHKAFLAVYSKDRPDVKILDIKTSRPNDIKVDVQPLPPNEAKQVAGLDTGGHKLIVHVGPGMTLGNFREEVIVKTDHPQQPELRVQVIGKMTGPVNVVPAALMMHQASGKAGAQGDVIISVRNNRETKFEVEKAPKGIEVAINSLDAGGKKGRYKLTVTVPPGTAPQNIEGEVILKTDHPMAGQVSVPVSIWVQN